MRPYIVADNQNITCAGLTVFITELVPQSEIVYVKDRIGLLEQLKKFPDAVLILDYTLFDFHNVQQLLILKESNPKSSWILFSDELSDRFIREILINDNSFSIVFKKDSKENILKALHEVLNYHTYHCELAEELRHETLPNPILTLLTNSEKNILREIAKGKTTKQIALEKHLSFHTVNAHRKNIFRKLEVNNVHEAIRYAFRVGIIDPAEYVL